MRDLSHFFADNPTAQKVLVLVLVVMAVVIAWVTR
jgi:hypothetical protein